jgi:uroporphyrinogen-III synthase
MGAECAIWLRYRMAALMAFPAPAKAALAAGQIDAVLHFSAESARAYLALAAKADCLPEAMQPRQICLSSAIAKALIAAAAAHGQQFEPPVIAAHPDMASLIAAANSINSPGSISFDRQGN